MPEFQLNENVVLRPFVKADAQGIYETVKENIGHLHKFLHWANDEYNLQSAEAFVEQSRIAAQAKTNQSLGIFYDGKIIGSVGFVSYNWTSKRTEIGYWIAKDYEGRGIVTRACTELIKYAFDKLEMNRIEIRCATENARSRRIPEKLNFKLEGIFRQSEWRHTRFYDMAIYGLLEKEWKKQ